MNLIVDSAVAPRETAERLQHLLRQWDPELYGVGFPSASFYGRREAIARTNSNAVDAAVVALWGFGIPRENIVFTFVEGEMNEQCQFRNCTLTLEWIPRPDLETS